MKETLAVVAAILAIAGNLPYLWDILKGRVQPHPYTWLVWTIVSGIIFFGQVAKGAGIGALPTAAYSSTLFAPGVQCRNYSALYCNDYRQHSNDPTYTYPQK